MLHYSNDARTNALFLHAECAGELDDCLYALELLHDEERPDDDEVDHLAGVYVSECESLAQEEIDRWYDERERVL